MTQANNRPSQRPAITAPAEEPNSWEAILKRHRRSSTGDVDLEGLRDGLRKGDDEQEHQRAVMGDDGADFEALRSLVNDTRLPEDEGLRALRKLVNDHYRAQVHRGLDKVLDRLGERQGRRRR